MASAGGTNGSPPERQHGAVPGTASGGTALLVTLAMAQFMVVLDFTIVNVALPSIQHGLHVATTTLQWLVSAYAVTFGGFLLLGGRLADMFGRARMYRVGLCIFVVASIGAVAGDPAEAPGGLESGPGARRRKLGSLRRAPPRCSSPGGARPGQQRGHPLGVYGAGGIDRPTEPALAVGAALVLLAAFVVRERTTAAPLFDLDLLKDRGILGANICLLAYGASNAGEVLLVTLYLQEGRGLSPLFTGLCFIPQAAGAFALAGPASRIVPGLGPRRALAAGTSLSVLALVGSALSVGHGSLIGLLVALFIMGISARVVQVASTLAGTEGPVAAKAEGSASALLTATRQIRSALGVAFLSATLVIAPGNASERTEVAMLAAASFSFLGLLATRIVPTGTAHPRSLRPEHLFGRHGGGLP